MNALRTAAVVPTLARELRARAPRLLPARKRASVAIIVRVVDVDADGDGVPDTAATAAGPAGFLDSRAAATSTPANTEILFMKRTSREGDPWSGNVAFPGGKAEAGDADDIAAAVRETREEVGLRLDDASAFLYLGRLDDRAVYERGRRRGDFALCPCVWVQTTPVTPPMRLQPSEVAAARWVPISDLTPDAVDAFAVAAPFRLLPQSVSVALGVATAHHPSILLRPPGGGGSGGSGGGAPAAGAPRGLAARVASELATSAPAPPAFGTHDDPAQRFQLWGLTLAATSDLLALLGRPRLNWPPLRFRGTLADAGVAAICGAIEVAEVLAGRRAPAAVSPRHAAWAAAAAVLPLAALAWAAGGPALLPAALGARW